MYGYKLTKKSNSFDENVMFDGQKSMPENGFLKIKYSDQRFQRYKYYTAVSMDQSREYLPMYTTEFSTRLKSCKRRNAVRGKGRNRVKNADPKIPTKKSKVVNLKRAVVQISMSTNNFIFVGILWLVALFYTMTTIEKLWEKYGQYQSIFLVKLGTNGKVLSQIFIIN